VVSTDAASAGLVVGRYIPFAGIAEKGNPGLEGTAGTRPYSG
jgi:hypothetical protein